VFQVSGRGEARGHVNAGQGVGASPLAFLRLVHVQPVPYGMAGSLLVDQSDVARNLAVRVGPRVTVGCCCRLPMDEACFLEEIVMSGLLFANTFTIISPYGQTPHLYPRAREEGRHSPLSRTESRARGARQDFPASALLIRCEPRRPGCCGGTAGPTPTQDVQGGAQEDQRRSEGSVGETEGKEIGRCHHDRRL